MLLLIQILRQRSWPPFLFTSVRQPYTLLSPTAVVPNHQAVDRYRSVGRLVPGNKYIGAE